MPRTRWDSWFLDLPEPSSENRPIEVENLDATIGCRIHGKAALGGERMGRRGLCVHRDLAERRYSGVVRETIRPSVRKPNIVGNGEMN